jgi:putative transposase
VKKHSSAAIIEKLARADQLAIQGVSQTTICRELGISVMTLHRWRARASGSAQTRLEQRLLQENNRLRDAAADLLLEIRVLEEKRDQSAAPAPPNRLLDAASGDADLPPQREQAEAAEA